MTTKTRLARLFRALSGLSVRRFAEKAGLDPSLVSQYDTGATQPGDENLARMACAAGLTVRDGERVLRFAETLRRERQRAAPGLDALLGELVSEIYERILRLPLPPRALSPEDRLLAEEQWALLRDLSEGQQRAVVRVVAELQTRALAERVHEEAAVETTRNPERAAWLAELGGLIAERAREGQPDNPARGFNPWLPHEAPKGALPHPASIAVAAGHPPQAPEGGDSV